jgi:hypothetical protein
LEIIPGSGLLAACVPGAFGAWMTLLREHGTMPLRHVMEYAITYAEAGCPLAEPIASVISRVAPLFSSEWTESASVYLTNGVPQPAALFRNRDLATTYRRILAEAEHAGGGREAQIDAAMHSFCDGTVRGQAPIKSRPFGGAPCGTLTRGQIPGKAATAPGGSRVTRARAGPAYPHRRFTLRHAVGVPRQDICPSAMGHF